MNEIIKKTLIYGAVSYLAVEIIRLVSISIQLKKHEEELRELEERRLEENRRFTEEALDEFDKSIEALKKELEMAKQNDEFGNELRDLIDRSNRLLN